MAENILNEISHRRFNALRGSWLMVSPHRASRPWQGQREAPPNVTTPIYDQSCYLCPGNKRAQGDINLQYEKTFVFANDFSCFKEDQPEYNASEAAEGLFISLLRAEGVTGNCYVVTFNPSHNITLADMSAKEIVPVIETWTHLYRIHLSPGFPLSTVTTDLSVPLGGYQVLATSGTQTRYMLIFENKGAVMGCSNPHPHGQVWAVTCMPEEPGIELEQLKKYRKEHKGAHLLEHYSKLEASKGERVVFENEAFLIVCPWWAMWPFETIIISKVHRRALIDFSQEEREMLACAVSEITRRYDNLFEMHFPYSMGVHQAPLEGTSEEVEASHFHIHFYPLFRGASVRKFLVGYELFGEPGMDITPEQAAEQLRQCGGPLYRNKPH